MRFPVKPSQARYDRMTAATPHGKARPGGSGPLQPGRAASSPVDDVIADRGRGGRGRGRSPQSLPVDRKLDTGGLAASVERNDGNRNAVMLGAWKWIAILGAGSRLCFVGQSQNGIRGGGCVGLWRESCCVGAWTNAGPLAAVTMRGSAASRLSHGSMTVQALAQTLGPPNVPDCLEFPFPCLLGVYFSGFRS